MNPIRLKNTRAALEVSASGQWRDRLDLRDALAAHAPKFLLGGCELFDLETRYRHHIDTHEDPGGVRVTCSDTAMTAASAREIQRAATALVLAGATQIQVHTSGITHPGVAWRRFSESGGWSDLYSAYVRFVSGVRYFASCGMHAFGMPDVHVSAEVGLVEASNAIAAFNVYALERRPILATGHWFTGSDNGPRFRLRRADCEHFPREQSLHNPFGVWQLHAH
jgi:hypothetical protein